MKGLAKSKKVTSDLQACNTETRQKRLFWAKIIPLRENFQHSSTKIQISIHVFA